MTDATKGGSVSRAAGTPSSVTTVLYRVAVLMAIFAHALLGDIGIGEKLVVCTNNEDALWEVVLRIDGSDVASAAAFERSDGNFDVVMGLVEKSTAKAISELIVFAAKLIAAGQYSESGDGIYASGSSGDEISAPPF